MCPNARHPPPAFPIPDHHATHYVDTHTPPKRSSTAGYRRQSALSRNPMSRMPRRSVRHHHRGGATHACMKRSSFLRSFANLSTMTDANITMASSPPESQFQTDQTAAGPSSNGPNAANGSSARASASALNGAVAVNGSAAHAASSGAPDSALANGDPQDLNQMYAARREEEMARRDRSLAEFLVMLDGYKPLVRVLPRRWCVAGDYPRLTQQIPEEVTEYYLQRAGFECSDPRL